MVLMSNAGLDVAYAKASPSRWTDDLLAEYDEACVSEGLAQSIPETGTLHLQTSCRIEWP